MGKGRLNTRILYVEDDDTTSMVIKSGLEMMGYDVHHASTRYAAREKLADAHYDVAIVDQQLPDGLGLELIHELRNHGTSAIMTTHCESEVADELRGLGAAFVAKPTTAAALAPVIDSLRMRDDQIAATEKRIKKARDFDIATGLYMARHQCTMQEADRAIRDYCRKNRIDREVYSSEMVAMHNAHHEEIQILKSVTRLASHVEYQVQDGEFDSESRAKLREAALKLLKIIENE